MPRPKSSETIHHHYFNDYYKGTRYSKTALVAAHIRYHYYIELAHFIWGGGERASLTSFTSPRHVEIPEPLSPLLTYLKPTVITLRNLIQSCSQPLLVIDTYTILMELYGIIRPILY